MVDVAICSEDSDTAKPHPGPVLRALEKLRVEPERAVMVGDTPVDVAAGIAAGVHDGRCELGPFRRDSAARRRSDGGGEAARRTCWASCSASARTPRPPERRHERPRIPRAARSRREEGRQPPRPWPTSLEPMRRRSTPRSRPPSRRAARRAPRACSWSPRPGREWLDERYPEVFADFRADPDATRGLRALRADQPRAALALHRLADDARAAASGSPTTTPTPTTTPAIDRPPRRPARARASGARRASPQLEPRLGDLHDAGSTTAYDKVLAGEQRLRQRRPHRQLPHGLVRAARGPAAHAGPRREEAAGRDARSCRPRASSCDGRVASYGREVVVGNKGAQHRLDALSLGLPVPPAFVPADRGVPPLPRRRRRARRRGLGGRCSPGSPGSSETARPPLRRPRARRCSSRSARAPR